MEKESFQKKVENDLGILKSGITKKFIETYCKTQSSSKETLIQKKHVDVFKFVSKQQLLDCQFYQHQDENCEISQFEDLEKIRLNSPRGDLIHFGRFGKFEIDRISGFYHSLKTKIHSNDVVREIKQSFSNAEKSLFVWDVQSANTLFGTMDFGKSPTILKTFLEEEFYYNSLVQWDQIITTGARVNHGLVLLLFDILHSDGAILNFTTWMKEKHADMKAVHQRGRLLLENLKEEKEMKNLYFKQQQDFANEMKELGIKVAWKCHAMVETISSKFEPVIAKSCCPFKADGIVDKLPTNLSRNHYFDVQMTIFFTGFHCQRGWMIYQSGGKGCVIFKIERDDKLITSVLKTFLENYKGVLNKTMTVKDIVYKAEKMDSRVINSNLVELKYKIPEKSTIRHCDYVFKG